MQWDLMGEWKGQERMTECSSWRKSMWVISNIHYWETLPLV